MAAKKWPSWVIGVAGVASFVTFLSLTQKKDEVTSGTIDQANLEVANSTVQNSTATPETTTKMASGTTIRFFSHNKTAFEQIVNGDAETKAARVTEVSQLDWSMNSVAVTELQKIDNADANGTYTETQNVVTYPATTSDRASSQTSSTSTSTRKTSDRKTKRS